MDEKPFRNSNQHTFYQMHIRLLTHQIWTNVFRLVFLLGYLFNKQINRTFNIYHLYLYYYII